MAEATQPERRLSVVGVVGGEVFGADARRAIERADVLVASRRHQERFPSAASAWIEVRGPLPSILDQVSGHLAAGRRVCVLSSGDPGFFGIVRVLGERCGRAGMAVHPAPSSVSLAWAAVGESWDDAVVVSAHGRPLHRAVPQAMGATKVAVLTSPTNTPEVLGRALRDAGCGERDVTVVSRLGEHDESIQHTDLDGLADGSYHPMSVVLLRRPEPGVVGRPAVSWGRDEATFEHRAGMITKREVRAVVLAYLELPPTGVLWDIGAGSGSVGIEAATLAPNLQVHAVERCRDDAGNITANAVARGVGGKVTVVVADASETLDHLPDPDRVFVGGGGLGVLEACWLRLAPGGVLVATFAVLDRAVQAMKLLGNLTQLHVDRAVAVGDAGMRLSPNNPVFVCWGRR